MINIAVVAEVAAALKEIKDNMVFVGGAVISLYTDDPAADEVRATQDIDMAMNIKSLNHWQVLQEKLGELGFHPDPFGHAICSYKDKDISVDIMTKDDGPFGPTNQWYKIGFENLWTAKAMDQEINILSAPCYLATKFEAFKHRGSDYRTSHDIEDIIYLIDNRTTIVEEVKKSDPRIHSFLKEEIQIIINQGLLTEVLSAHTHPLLVEDRLPILEDKITQISES